MNWYFGPARGSSPIPIRCANSKRRARRLVVSCAYLDTMNKSSEPPAATGVFETLAVIDGRPRLLERHLARLLEGCKRLNLRAPSESLLAAKIHEQAANPGTGVIKVIVQRVASTDPNTPPWTVRAEPPRPRPLE